MTATRDELVARRDELLVAAFDGVLETLNNPTAPPTAKASATQSAIRLFEELKSDDGLEKEPSQMTGDELNAATRRLQRMLQGVPDEEVDED